MLRQAVSPHAAQGLACQVSYLDGKVCALQRSKVTSQQQLENSLNREDAL